MKKTMPQAGYQTTFLTSSADIVVGGGAAGAGKTFALLMEAARHTNNKGFSGIVFRKTSPQITNAGGLWDESLLLYSELINPPRAIKGALSWIWQSGAKLKFSHLQHEKNIYDYQGSQIPFIGWDELTHFSEKEFFYLLSRNRSTCGVKPYIRATCNPQTSGWLKDFLQWWLYPDNYKIEGLQGYAIPERKGVVRYFFREASGFSWGDSKIEVIINSAIFKDRVFLESLKESNIHPFDLIKSITFISGSINDNQELMRVNPEYMSNLHALPDEERDKMLGGCWKAKAGADILCEYSALYDMFTNDFVDSSMISEKRYITADIALEGSDMFVIQVWNGWRVVDTVIMEKSKGNEIVEAIKASANEWSVPQSNICYDADGVGGFISGYLPNAISFHNGGSTIKVDDEKQDYENLKTQCAHFLARKINSRQIYIASETHKNQTIKECFAVRKVASNDNKVRISKKDEIKKRLGGASPDYFDSLMMRSIFDLNPIVEYDYSTAIID